MPQTPLEKTLVNVLKELEKLDKAFADLKKVNAKHEKDMEELLKPARMERRRANMQAHPSYPVQSEVVKVVPMEIDWSASAVALRHDATFTRMPDGRLVISVEIEGEDASIVEDLLHSMPVEKLQLSVYEA